MDHGHTDSDVAPARGRRSLHKSHGVQFVVGVLVTLGCLFWAFASMADQARGETWRDVLHKIGAAFAQADYWRTLPFLWLMLAVFYWLKAHRWKLLLAPVGTFDPERDLLPPIMAGFAFNNVLPARLGELVRVFLFARTQRVAMTTALATVAVERVLDALTILVLLGIGISQLDYVDPNVHRYVQTGGVMVGGAVAVIIAYLIWTRPFLAAATWCAQRVPFVPARFSRKIVGMLEAGAVGLQALKQARLLGGILATSLLQWVLNALFIECALWAFAIRLPWESALVLMGAVAFGVAVPSVPGYFGVMQFWFLLVLRTMPIYFNEADVFAASIYYQMAQFIPVTLIGLWCANRMGFRMSEIRRDDPRSGSGVRPDGELEADTHPDSKREADSSACAPSN